MERALCARVLLGSALCIVASSLPSRASCPLRLEPLPDDIGFGISMAFLGDVNGDGFADFAIGATKPDAPGDVVPGRVHVYFGGPERDGVADATFVGEADGDRFGLVVAAAGDWNNDGWRDILVGAPGNDANGTDAGRAYIFFGGPGFDDVPDVVLTGPAAGMQFGAGVAGGGDLNGDGFADVVVGAPLATYGNGSAYVYFGGPGFDSVPDQTLTGAYRDHFGSTLAMGADVSGDGYEDLVVGAPFANGEAGRAYLFWGGPIFDARSDRAWSGLAAGDRFGTAISLGDVNDDAVGDVVIGAPRRSNNQGYVYVFESGAYGASLVLGPGQWGSMFGSFVAAGADLNGDAVGDLAVGAPGYYGINPLVQIYLGGSGIDAVPDLTWRTSEGYSAFGGHGAIGPDFDGDGADEILVGAAGPASLGPPPFVHIESLGRFIAEPGEVVVPRFCIRSLDGRVQQLDVTTADALSWGPASTTTVTLAPGDSVCVETNERLPSDASCDFTSTLRCAVLVSGCSVSPTWRDMTLEREIPEPMITWCHAPDSLASAGDSVRIAFRVVNPSTATRDFIYELAGTSGCGRETHTITVAPRDSFVAGRTCVVSEDLQCGDMVYLYARVRDACTVPIHGLGWVWCDHWITIDATACAEPWCPKDDVVVGGTSVDRPFRIGNCSDRELTYDYTITDSLGWGTPRSGTITLGPGLVWDGSYALDTPLAPECPIEDPVTLEVRAHTCFERPFACTTKVYARPPATAVPLRAYTGSASNGAFGTSIALPGDLNFDGHEDLVVGDPGHADVFFGGPGEDGIVDLVLTTGGGGGFGAAVAPAGDWNADGIADLAVGAPDDDSDGPDRGRVYVYLGRPSIDATPERRFEGLTDYMRLGKSVAGVGDVNGDGVDDIAAAGGDVVLVYFGGTDMDTQADVTLVGMQPYEHFGDALAGAGDLNADGWRDIAVGAPGNQTGGPDAGAVYVFFGGPGMDGVADIVCYGTGGVFGAHILGADANGDGISDLLVGARHYDHSAGRVEVFLGGPAFDDLPDAFLQVGIDGEQFSSGLAVAGDLDGDGYADFLVGATGFDFYDYGRVWIARGGPDFGGACDGILVGSGGFSGWGRILAGGRDLIGNGHPDLFVGVPGGRRVDLYTNVLLAPNVVSNSQTMPPMQRWDTAITRLRDDGTRGIRIEYTIGPHPAAVRFDVYNVMGRRIRSLTEVPGTVGTHGIIWDRRDSAGIRVARSVYLVQLHTDKTHVSRKVVVASP